MSRRNGQATCRTSAAPLGAYRRLFEESPAYEYQERATVIHACFLVLALVLIVSVSPNKVHLIVQGTGYPGRRLNTSGRNGWTRLSWRSWRECGIGRYDAFAQVSTSSAIERPSPSA